MRNLSGKQVVTSAFLSGSLNAVLLAASISSAHEVNDTFIQAFVRMLGLPAGLFVQAVAPEGHGALQAVLVMAFSFAFYWILIWAVWTAVQRWRKASESRRRL